MFVKYVLPLIAVLGLAFAIYTVREGRKPQEVSKPIVDPPKRPTVFENQIAGAFGDALAPSMIVHAVYAGHRYARELDAVIDPDAVPFLRNLPR